VYLGRNRGVGSEATMAWLSARAALQMSATRPSPCSSTTCQANFFLRTSKAVCWRCRVLTTSGSRAQILSRRSTSFNRAMTGGEHSWEDDAVGRVSVVGTSGSGKTAVSSELAARLGIPHFELDATFHQPGWTELPVEDFRAAQGTRAGTGGSAPTQADGWPTPGPPAW